MNRYIDPQYIINKLYCDCTYNIMYGKQVFSFDVCTE